MIIRWSVVLTNLKHFEDHGSTAEMNHTEKYSYVGKSVEISKERHVSPGKSNPIFH